VRYEPPGNLREEARHIAVGSVSAASTTAALRKPLQREQQPRVYNRVVKRAPICHHGKPCRRLVAQDGRK